MRYAFIGMSNIGKTYWSKRVAAELKIEHINCDALIEKKIGGELEQQGFHGSRSLAEWMGQPFDTQYKANSERYTAHEQAVMRASLDRLKTKKNVSAVIDTTGSVIYTGADILADLRTETRVIYLEASEAYIEDLFRRYIAHPKPVIWHNHYRPQVEETFMARCIVAIRNCCANGAALPRDRACHDTV